MVKLNPCKQVEKQPVDIFMNKNQQSKVKLSEKMKLHVFNR